MSAVQIRIADTDPALYHDLSAWLNESRALRGRVTPVAAPAREGGLGGWIELLEVALGAGGAGAVLAQSLALWLRNQRADIEITVKRGDDVATVKASRVADAQSILEEVLREHR